MMDTKKYKMAPVDKKIEEDLRKLVIARIKAASGDLKISVGGPEGYTREDLIRSVEKGDEIGQEIVSIQHEYLKDVAQGKIYKFEDDIDNKAKS